MYHPVIKCETAFLPSLKDTLWKGVLSPSVSLLWGRFLSTFGPCPKQAQEAVLRLIAHPGHVDTPGMGHRGGETAKIGTSPSYTHGNVSLHSGKALIATHQIMQNFKKKAFKPFHMCKSVLQEILSLCHEATVSNGELPNASVSCLGTLFIYISLHELSFIIVTIAINGPVRPLTVKSNLPWCIGAGWVLLLMGLCGGDGSLM